MRRRDALRTLLLGIGSWGLLRAVPARAGAPRRARPVDACWVTPEEDEGPYYLDAMPERSDIRESRDGVPLTLLMTVLDSECRPAAGVMVDVWHCDKDGVYSGITQPGHDPQVGQTFLRGTQSTDAQGRVQFVSIYPGWYTNRATHVHFKARTPEVLYKTSQFCFPEDVNAAVYGTSLYSRRGANPTSNTKDGTFGEPAPQYLTLVLTGDSASGYVGTFTIGLDASTPARRRSWGRLKTHYH
jgi:hypothetical protein